MQCGQKRKKKFLQTSVPKSRCRVEESSDAKPTLEHLGLRNPRSGKVSSSTCGSAWLGNESCLRVACISATDPGFMLTFWLSQVRAREWGTEKPFSHFPFLKRHPCKFWLLFSSQVNHQIWQTKTLHSMVRRKGALEAAKLCSTSSFYI